MADTITDLRGHLFDTLRSLRDPAKPMDLDRAKAVADVARTIIDTAKVEVSFLKVTGSIDGTGFIPPPGRQLSSAPPNTKPDGLAPLRPARRP
jgi:hypothetical protein